MIKATLFRLLLVYIFITPITIYVIINDIIQHHMQYAVKENHQFSLCNTMSQAVK